MALIRSFEKRSLSKPQLHDEIEASYAVVEKDGRVLLQIDTYGRSTREKPGKQSQTIQFDRVGAERLFLILKEAFDL